MCTKNNIMKNIDIKDIDKDTKRAKLKTIQKG